MIISSSSIETLDLNILNDLPNKILQRKFGGPNDVIELGIYNFNGELLLLDNNFKEYKGIYEDSKDTTTRSLFIDYEKVLKDYGFTYGKYRMVFSFQRKYFTPDDIYPFYVSEISPSRNEIRLKSTTLEFDQVVSDMYTLQNEILSSIYVRDINALFPNGDSYLILNIALDPNTGDSLLIKLYNPLDTNIVSGNEFKISEEIINPIEVNIDLGNRIIDDNSIELFTPNFDLYKVPPSSPSSESNYEHIQQNGASSASFNELNQFIYSSIPVDLQFTNENTPSGYTFENFIHFGSAVERLLAFREKLRQIEIYNISSSILDTITGDITSSHVILEEKSYWDNSILEVIKSFDPYERFLYYESNSYAWPKSDSTRPYTNVSINSIEAISWLGYELEGYPGVYTEGQLKLASEYDDYNVNNLVNTIPEFISSNPSNSTYLRYVNLVGHHFDSIWAYINSITDILEADNALGYGISKGLIRDMLYQLGIPQYDQFENSNMFEYFLGSTKDGTYQYQPIDSENITMISASNAGSIPKGDITKEIWKRLYHNAPYLLKTKGTERGLKALIACYGIPETVLHVKEYGGPLVDKTGFRSFTYQKESKMATLSEGAVGVIVGDTRIPNTTKTLQVRFLPTKGSTTAFDLMSIVPFGSSNDIVIGISQSLDNFSINSASFAHLVIASGSLADSSAGRIKAISSSSLGPIYNGKVWNLSVRLNSGSSNGNTIEAFATNTTFNRNTYVLSCSMEVPNFFTDLNHINNTIIIGNTFGIGVDSAFGNLINPFTGSIQEYRAWTEKLTESTIVTQSLSPFNYNGNTISSSFETLFQRLSLGSNNKDIIPDTRNDAPVALTTEVATIGPHVISIPIEETHHLITPDTVGSGMVSDKVRIDNSTSDNNFLDPFTSVEVSPQDRQPLDYSDLGVFFSPTFELNEDIIYTFGGFRLDDYIGDPTYYTSGSYPALNNLKKLYRKKLERRINIFDYIRTIQFFDHTLFKHIENFVPAKSNLKTGLVIEPHYLERTKLPGKKINIESQTEYLLSYSPSGSISSTNEDEYLLNVNVFSYVESGSYVGATENVVQRSRLSKKYFRPI